jgi:hypothetical protein
MNSQTQIQYYTVLLTVLKQTLFYTKDKELKEALNHRIEQYKNYINNQSEVVSYKQLPQWKRLNKSSRPQVERVAKHHVDETVRYIKRPLFDNNQDNKDFESGLYDAVMKCYLTRKPIEFGIVTVLPQDYTNSSDAYMRHQQSSTGDNQ